MDNYNWKIAPDNIKDLQDNEIFVFGSNESGFHGAGAAKLAMKWGAKWGQGVGLFGQTYAIPTKDYEILTLSLKEIKVYTNEFIRFANNKRELKFIVTAIGCGLAGYLPKDIAPLFKLALEVDNIYLPKSFLDILLK